MGKIIVGGNVNAPRIQCAHCKHQNIIDIRGWNKDVTQIGEIICKLCRGKMYVSLLILANTNIPALGQNVECVVQALQAGNMLRPGEDPKIKLS